MTKHDHGPDETCAMCDGDGVITEAKMTAFINQCENTIKEFGWMCQGVMANPPYTYSIGMSRLELPEIIMVGFSMQVAHKLINHVGMLMKTDHAFTDWSKSTEVINTFPVYFREIQASSIEEHCGGLIRIEGKGKRMLQLFIPDKAGYFPWQKRCTPAFKKQYELNLIYKTIVTQSRMTQ